MATLAAMTCMRERSLAELESERDSASGDRNLGCARLSADCDVVRRAQGRGLHYKVERLEVARVMNMYMRSYNF